MICSAMSFTRFGGSAELGVDGSQRGNTDQVALQVYQCAAAVARVDRRVGLDGVWQRRAVLAFGGGTVQGADDAVRYRLRETKRAADSQHILPNLQL